ncbi:MAG: hypothetical protein ACRDYU_15780 [Actinomycetes bacterium]
MLTRIYRDKDVIAPTRRRELDARDVHLRDVLHQPFRTSRARSRRLRAVLRHAVSFWAWRSLCVDQGMSNLEAVDAMSALALATATPARRARKAVSQ